MTINEVKELGWNRGDMWNNRIFYELSEESQYAIFEHNGDWGILNPFNKEFELIYCNLTDKEIIKFTELVKKIENITNKPKDYTFDEYSKTVNKLHNFIKEMKDKL